MAIRANRKKRQKRRAVKYMTGLIVIGTIALAIYSFNWNAFEPETPESVRALEPVGELELLDERAEDAQLIIEESLRHIQAPIPASYLEHLLRSRIQSENLPFHRIRIGLRDGIITLTGRVATLQARQKLELFVRDIHGIDRVHNELEVIGYPPENLELSEATLKN